MVRRWLRKADLIFAIAAWGMKALGLGEPNIRQKSLRHATPEKGMSSMNFLNPFFLP